MDSLKAELARKRQEKKAAFGGKKYVKRGAIIEKNLKRLREEEEQELVERGKKRPADHELARQSSLKRRESEEKVPDLTKDEAIRRLRALGQPATLFGEDDLDRLLRLKGAEENMNIEDETIGGQQANTLLELAKEEKERLNAAKREAVLDMGKNEDNAKEQQDGNLSVVDATMGQFQRAAARLSDRQQEDKLPVEERIVRTIERWFDEWQEDLDARRTEVAETRSGRQATMAFRQNRKWMEPLYERLRRKYLPREVVAGLWMIVEGMKARNYQHAYEIYLKLAIGNAPWPIGVTSVGIHERSAREKISHVRNLQGQAHIMNDEGTRKYLQGIKRLMTFVQRAYPTVPSRSVDFNSVDDPGRGAAGAGSDKVALLMAEERGVGPEQLKLPPAPHFLEKDGSVRVPPRWANTLKRSEEILSKEARDDPPPQE